VNTFLEDFIISKPTNAQLISRMTLLIKVEVNFRCVFQYL